MYTHLHLHSHYSLLSALGEPKAYISKAKQLEMNALALTDYNGMYGVIEHYKYCKKSGIKPIIGVELSYTQQYTSKQSQLGTLVLIAKNYTGYEHLLSLTTHANLEGWNNAAYIDESLLRQHNIGLYILFAGTESLLAKMISTNEPVEKIREQLKIFADIYGKEHIILSCIVGDEDKNPDIARINYALIALHQSEGYILICGPSVHIIAEQDKEHYEVFLCIKENKKIYDADRPRITQPLWLMSEQEIYTQMIQQGYENTLVQSMINTTQVIVDTIDLNIPLGTAMFPKYEASEHIQTLYQQSKCTLL